MCAKTSGKPSKVKRVNLKKIGRKYGEVMRFGNALLDGLGDSIFNYRSMTELLYDVLSQISPTYKTLEKNDVSIEIECAKILTHFGIGRVRAKMYRFTDTGKEEVPSKKKTKTATGDFCEDILQLAKLPGPIYEWLADEVDEDLRIITRLISRYELEPFIQKHIQFDYIPTSQHERMTFDFYKRCVRERGEIIRYRLEGVKPRALQRARRVHDWVTRMIAFTDPYHDRPYDFARMYSIHRFDTEQLDLASHRVGDFPIRESHDLEKLYTKDKAKFYRIYFKHISPAQHFHNLLFYLGHLPLRNDRKPIFEELIRLFKGRRWMSFYALALPQVEGLFSEMCEIAIPKTDFSRRALPYKVESLRPYSPGSYSYFDYYQYYIPLQRNKFAHTGFDDDLKMKSFDLLSDLVHLLSVFYELDNPLVKVQKLHKRREQQDFISVSDWNHYFSLLQSLPPEQRNEIGGQILEFEESFLWPCCDLEYTCQTLIEDYPRLAKKYIDDLDNQLNFLSLGFTFETLTIAEIKGWNYDTPALETLLDQFHLHDNVRQLEDSLAFLTRYKPSLKKMPKTVQSALGAVVKEHSLEIHKLVTLFEKFRQSEKSK